MLGYKKLQEDPEVLELTHCNSYFSAALQGHQVAQPCVCRLQVSLLTGPFLYLPLSCSQKAPLQDSRAAPSNSTSCDSGKVLHQQCPIQEPLDRCNYWDLKCWWCDWQRNELLQKVLLNYNWNTIKSTCLNV